MTKSIQQQCADRLYELLPHKKDYVYHDREGNAPEVEEVFLPLRLAEILIAMNSVAIVRLYSEGLAIESLGRSEIYNLSKDNILDQSDEFCEFLYKLIK